jgi:methyl-accepting chemotaxis protein
MSESLSDSANLIMKNYDAIRGFSEDVKDAANQMASNNKETLDELSTLTGQIDRSVASLGELSTALKVSADTNASTVLDMSESFKQAIISTTGEIGHLSENLKNAFAQALKESGEIISTNTSVTMEKSVATVLQMSEAFNNNQKILAQTIVALPEQTMIYNKSAAGKIQKKLDDIEKAIKKD